MKYTGQLVTGDFEDNTMTFEIEGKMVLQSGKYSIEQIESGEQKKQVTIPNVSKSFTYKDISKVTVIGYVNDWVVVEDINHKKPFCLPFEYVKNIYDEMLENKAKS